MEENKELELNNNESVSENETNLDDSASNQELTDGNIQEKKWSELYASYINKSFSNWDEYFQTKIKLKKKFLKLVLKYASTGKPVLECGAGTGKFSVYLSMLGLDVHALDLEKEMVEQTINLSKTKHPENPVKAVQGDAFNIPYEDGTFSVTHSSGVLEHYSDEEIVKLINEQLRVSDVCVFSVPTAYFEKKMLGNERFLSRKKWREIISKSDATIIKETGYHYKTFKNRLKDIIKKPSRMFKPIALYVFVLKKKENK